MRLAQFLVLPLLSALVGVSSPHPFGIVAGPDGALWFTDVSGSIDRITTAGTFARHPLADGSLPLAITRGADGALWFTQSGNATIGRITTAGKIDEFKSPVAHPSDITTARDGTLWITGDQRDNAIGRLTVHGVGIVVATLAPPSWPRDIVAGPDGALWFTEFAGNKIGRVTLRREVDRVRDPNAR